jgi:hypothetical protein
MCRVIAEPLRGPLVKVFRATRCDGARPVLAAAVGVMLGALALGLANPAIAQAQEEGDLLTHGITGSVPANTPDTQSPGLVLSLKRVQELLLEVAESPRDRSHVEAALAGTEITPADLVAMHSLREENGEYVIDFTFLTADDQRLVRDVSHRYGRSLAEAHLQRWPEIEETLSVYHMEHVDQRAVAFVLLGCFSLDWAGLRLTSELGYRGAREGWQYYLWAVEKRDEFSVKGFYWGGHSEYTEDLALTSFGDHFALPRYGLPDLLWRMQGSLRHVAAPEEVRSLLRQIGSRQLDPLYEQVMDMMMALRSAEKTAEQLGEVAGTDTGQTQDLLRLLEELEYIRQVDGRYAAIVPVFAEADRPMVLELLRIGREVMEPWLHENYERIQADLGAITPLKYGVPYIEVFNQIWHYIFGYANQILIEEDKFFDPYGGTRKFEGFVPVVWHRSVVRPG